MIIDFDVIELLLHLYADYAEKRFALDCVTALDSNTITIKDLVSAA